MLLVDDQGCIVQANRQAYTLFGYTGDDLTARRVENLIPARFHETHTLSRTGFFRHPSTRIMGGSLDLRGLRKDGSEFPVEISLSPLRTVEGDFAFAAVRDVTARKAAEEALRASQERYRTLVENASDGIFTADETGRYTDVNTSGCRMTGYTREEILERSIADLVIPEEIPRITPAVEEMKQGRRHLGEWTFRRKDGTTFAGEVSGVLLSDGRLVGILRDVSERSRAEAALRESEERFRAAIDAMQEGFVMQNRSGEVTICNRSAERILGVTADQLMGTTSFDPRWKATREDGSDFPAEARPIALSRTHGLVQTDVVMGVQKPDGELVWVSTNSSPLWRGEEPYAAIATFTDITERRRSELALRESEARFRTLADSAPVIIWMTDAEGRCTYLNRCWLEYTGRELADGLGHGWTEDVHPEDRERMIETFERCLAERRPIRCELRLRRGDGQYRHILDVGVPRLAEDGRLLGYIGSGIDITEQKALQEQLFESQRLESLGRLAGGISHDFNNLLTAITGYTELARMEVASDSDAAQFLGNVTTAAGRAATLTKQLLMYARRQMVEFAPVDLNQVILGMDPLLRRTIGENYELVVSLEPDLWSVRTNAGQMEQVLMNLVVNARDATPKGGRIVVQTANVTLDPSYSESHPDAAPGEYAMFSVTDSGPGIPLEDQERIFEPFFTTKAVGKGTGLGLATCYGIVKQSSGIIDVESEPGRGTTFRVYLPRLDDPVIIEETIAREDVPTGTAVVLLVDDEPMVRDIAARSLRAQGYHVLEAGNGVDALNVARTYDGTIDLLMTDVVMPVMGGKELSERIRQVRPGIRVLYISGYTQNTVLQQGVLDPDVALLTKPFTSSDLVRKVREVLQQS